MLTINIYNKNEHIQSNNPEEVEIYIGAMESYEHFELGGIKWKIPTAMVEELTEIYLKQIRETGL